MIDQKDFIFNQGLIRTKCNLPGISLHLVLRQRLSEKLTGALDHKLTIVTAPAGYGKSTAVIVWLEQAGLPSAWVSLDANDNHPLMFWRYICAALDGVIDGISNDLSNVFSSQELLKANLHLSILIDRLVASQADIILVLDDFHLITELEVLDSFSYFISYLPPRVHVILLSRTEPELKLAKLGIKDELVRLDIDDLRFQTEEIARFYETRGLFLEKDDLDRAEAYTEGWVAVMVAGMLSLGENRDRIQLLKSLEHSNQLIDQYLQEEMFSHLPEDQQAFFLKTSILERLYGPLCDAVADLDNSNTKLQEIRDRNEFLIALDHENRWYRYHHLFSSFLCQRLSEQDPLSIPTLHVKAAQWYQENGLIYQAIDHYLQARRYETAVDLINSQVVYLVQKGDYAIILSWLERLPERFVRNSREMVAAMVSYYAELNSFGQAEQWMFRLREMVTEHRKTRSEAFYRVTQKMSLLIGAYLSLRQGKAHEFFVKIKEAAAMQGVKMPLNDNFMDANLFDISLYRGLAPLVSLFRTDRETFRSSVENYRPMIGKNPGYAPLIIGEFYYENNRLDEALPHLLSAIDEATQAGCPGALAPGMVTMARIKRAQNDLAAALEVVGECERRLVKINKPYWNYLLNAFKTRLYLEAGNRKSVAEWFAECKLGIYQEITRAREYELIVFARVLMERERFDDAAILLQRLLAFTEKGKRLHSMVEILNLLAVCASKTGAITKAMSFLERSLSIGFQEGYCRSFIDESTPMASLLDLYLRLQKNRKGIADLSSKQLTDYAANLLKEAKNNISKTAANKKMSSGVKTSIKCFGCFAIYQDGSPVNCKNSKVREILAFLVHNEGIAVGWEKIVEAIWPGCDYENAHANFHATMYLLRRFLADHSLKEILECSRGSYRIRPEKVNCDMYEFKRLLTKCNNGPEGKIKLLQAAGRLYTGGYFEEDGFGWAYAKAAELEALYLGLQMEKTADS